MLCAGLVFRVHMQMLSPMRVTIALGEREVSLLAAELAGRLGEPGLPGRLLGLLVAAHDPQLVHEEGGVGVGEVPRLPGTLERLSEISFSVSVQGKGMGSGEGENPGALLASYLATKLNDPKSLRWYRRVADSVPRHLIEDALRRALDLEPRETRRSRAALFTSLVRPHLSIHQPT